MMRKTLIAFSVVAALGAGAALAAPQDAKTPPAPTHKLDANGDGKVDRKEAAARPELAKRFDSVDKDKDGALSPDELPRPFHGERRHRLGERGHDRMAGLDANRDARVSAEEGKADPKFAEHFASMDVNKDGFVDRADRELRMKQHRDGWFTRADANKDGQLSRAEFDAAGPDRQMHGQGDREDWNGHHDRRGPGTPPPADAPAKN